nr:alpha/beta fold hydrolase [uncultured Rhodopila sp.]
MSAKIVNQAVTIGRRQSLVGIVTQPAGYVPSGRPVCVILNSGIIHRVGHHRMYVALARMLAAAGSQVLRFDLSGIGDSENRLDGLSPLDAAIADIREAVDWLATSKSAQRIILIGLCSGADHALIYGSSDPRVAGLVLLDPSIPPTLQYYCRYFARHLRQPKSWGDMLIGRGRVWNWIRKFLGDRSEEVLESHRIKLGDPAVRAYLESAYRRTMNLGTQCQAVFTSGFPHQHNYRRQILDAFPSVPFEGQLRLDYFDGCDHVFTSEADRKRLFGVIMKWIQQPGFVETLPAATTGEAASAKDLQMQHASHGT